MIRKQIECLTMFSIYNNVLAKLTKRRNQTKNGGNMRTSVTLKNAPEVKRVVLAAFPSYKKHGASISTFQSGVNINSYWDGGSRSEFAIVELATMQRKTLPTRTHPYFDVVARGIQSAENQVIAVDHVGNVTLKVLPEGFALVEAGTFCGKAATAHVYVNDANLTKLLPEETKVAESFRAEPTRYGCFNCADAGKAEGCSICGKVSA